MSTTTINNKSFQSLWNEIIDPKLPTEETSSNFLVPKVATYYRSKAFVSQVGINPLIAASAPLFFLIEKIHSLDTAPDIEKLYEDLIHEINAFEHQAAANGYRPYVILAARYVMCLWIDQTILKTSWGAHSQWQKISISDTHETEKDSPFFLLINRCLQEPDIYIDLLELFYLCLSLGFVENSISLKLNSTKITQTRDYLFEIISKKREEYSKHLEIDNLAKETHKKFSLQAFIRPSMLIFSAILLITTYFTLNTHLNAPLNGVISSSLSN